MANNEENVLLHTDGLEERVMKATGLTKNVVCKMLCDANETEDEVEKARILSHFIWHMPAGQLANTDSAKTIKKALVEDLAKEIGTEVPEDIMSSLTIEVKEDNSVNEPIDDTVDDPVDDTDDDPIDDTDDPIDESIEDEPIIKKSVINQPEEDAVKPSPDILSSKSKKA